MASMRDGRTILLGTQNDGTSLEGVDVYDDIAGNIKNIKNINHNVYEFYLKCGFKIVGLIPDAGGFEKTDILMAKRIS